MGKKKESTLDTKKIYKKMIIVFALVLVVVFAIVFTILIAKEVHKKNEREKIEKHFKTQKEAAEAGDAKAQYEMAMIYFTGTEAAYDEAAQTMIYGEELMEIDDETGLEWLTKAVKQDYRPAIAQYGSYLVFGDYVESDVEKGVQYLEMVSEDNYLAMTSLGSLYLQGGDYAKYYNIEKGIELLKAADEKGNYMLAQYNLALVYGTEAYGKLDYDKAIVYFDKAANQGYSPACFRLGKIYYEVESHRDLAKAKEAFLKAKELGVKSADSYLTAIEEQLAK